MMITEIKGKTLEGLGAIGLANLMSAQAEAALQKTGSRWQGRAGGQGGQGPFEVAPDRPVVLGAKRAKREGPWADDNRVHSNSILLPLHAGLQISSGNRGG